MRANSDIVAAFQALALMFENNPYLSDGERVGIIRAVLKAIISKK